MAADSAIDPGRFPTTRRSAVRGARSADAEERARSWDALALAYWKPVYKHVRVKWNASREDAEDATQGFFARAMERDFFATYDEARAKFRTFVRVCLDRFVANEHKARGRSKRGGGAVVLPLDFAHAERELALAGAAAWESPDACFDRELRRALFADAVDALRAECESTGKSEHFAIFEAYDLVSSGARPTYENLAAGRGIPVTTVTSHLAYTRRALGRLVLANLEAITATDGELRDEADALLGHEDDLRDGVKAR